MGASLLLAGLAASTAVQAVGQVRQGQAQQAAAKYQAQVAENNKLIAERAAQDAIERGKAEEAKARQRTRQQQGASRARAAARGVLVDEGSALLRVLDIGGAGEQDALTIRDNAAREALGFRRQAANFQSDVQTAELRGEQAQAATNFGVASTVLNGGSRVASQWYTFDSEGAFD